MSTVPTSATPRLPPQSLDAEISVLGCILLDNRIMDVVVDLLRPDDFYREAHRVVFQSMIDLYARGVPTDPVTLLDALKVHGHLEQAGGPEYLARLAEAVPTAANATHYARIVRDKAILRRFITVATDLLEEAYQEVPTVDEFVDRAESAVFAVGQQHGRQAPVPLRELVSETLAKLEDRMRERKVVTGVSSGFYDLDRMTAGLQPSDLIILAARPAMGKTALALNIATGAALGSQAPVAVFSLEMSREQLVTRTLSAQGRVPSERIRTGYLSPEDFQDLFRAADELSRAPLYIDDTPALSIMELRSKCRRLKADRGLGMVVVDYLQLMRGPAGT
ncbi:MAG: replicative DNA helicase, partial [Deltaproteobacteria bacterium]|nr:replicative DNA helicase [Deltaproteobacteria bacterium]